jgi:hypothetical protein
VVICVFLRKVPNCTFGLVFSRLGFFFFLPPPLGFPLLFISFLDFLLVLSDIFYLLSLDAERESRKLHVRCPCFTAKVRELVQAGTGEPCPNKDRTANRTVNIVVGLSTGFLFLLLLNCELT